MSTMQNNRKLYRLLNVASLILLLSLAVQAQNVWPQFRGPESNPVGTHPKLADRWSKTENVEWSLDVPGREVGPQADSHAAVLGEHARDLGILEDLRPARTRTARSR